MQKWSWSALALALVACGRVEDNRHLDAGTGVDSNGGIDVPMGPANLTVGPLTHEFGPVSLNQTSPAFTVTFTNTGAEPATGCSAPELRGANPTEFAISADMCGTADLAGGATCTVGVSAKPTVDGIRTTTVARTCAAGGSATTTANAFVVNRPMFIFVTSAGSNGNLGGLAGADAKCAAAGAAGSVSGPKNLTWKALLSVKTGTQVDAKTRFTWTGPMFSMTGQMITRNPSIWPWAATGTGGEPDRDQNNVTAQSYTWTGSTIDGLAAPADCNGWTDGTNAFNGRAGETGYFPASNWFDSYNNSCADTFFGLYCISQ